MSAKQPGQAGTMLLRLLDGFELTCDGEVVSVPLALQRLLALLALQTRALHRAHIARVLWFATAQGDAHACLRSALWRLRCCCSGPPLVEATRSHLKLASHVSVDVRAQTSVARELLAASADPDLVDYRLLLEGDLLPDWSEEWVELERERLRQLRLHALEALAAQLARKGRFGEAIEAALAAVRADSLRESAHVAVIKTYLAEGNRADALIHYRSYERLLRRKLGLGPPVELQQLVRHLVVGRRKS